MTLDIGERLLCDTIKGDTGFRNEHVLEGHRFQRRSDAGAFGKA